MKCSNCDRGEMKQRNIRGSKFPWKDYFEVGLMVDFMAMACEKCGEVSLKYKDYARLDKAIEKSIEITQEDCIRRLSTVGVSQNALATALGVTPQYISELKNGKKHASFSLYTQLRIFADKPALINQYTGMQIKLEENTSSWIGFKWNDVVSKEFDDQIKSLEQLLKVWSASARAIPNYQVAENTKTKIGKEILPDNVYKFPGVA